jgi:signal transduction histidine kinase
MMRMDGTEHTTRGLPRTTGAHPVARRRLAGLVVIVLLGTILTIWVSHTTWTRLDNLEQEFAGLNAESFYLGVRMRGQIQRLNDTLLRYRLRGDASDVEAFQTEVREFRQRLDSASDIVVTPLEKNFIDEIGQAYNEYLINSTEMLEAGIRWWQTREGLFPSSYEKVQEQSQRLLLLCDTFIENQRSAFDDFLDESNRTLQAFQRLLLLSLVLLFALATALVVLVYRGMIAPLRHELTESHAIIARQEKLASLGVLAAGVAHEIRNPLTAIKFRLFSLKKALSNVEAAPNEDAAVIGDEISRLERIVKDFLQFARPSEPTLISVPAERMMREVHDLLKPQLEKNSIELKLDSCEPVWVRADTQQIKQVLINLVQNAADSIEHDGVVTLRVHTGKKSSRKQNGSRVFLEVEDNGKGISPEARERLFDPFFTTKEGGCGLGLPIAARIVEKHGGELRHQTGSPRGTVFSIVLPEVSEHEA